MTLPAAYYEPIADDEFETTVATESPWDPNLQHGGPPAALLARTADRVGRPGMQIARITLDMLGGIPQGRIRTGATVVRPGKRIELIEARLWANDRLAVTASVWRLRVASALTGSLVAPAPDTKLPDEQPQRFFPDVSPTWGYGNSIEWRYVSGGFGNEDGQADVWTRVRLPLVLGEETSALCRLLVVADSVNGMSARLPISEWLSIPPSLTVTVQRPPAGEWMRFRANTQIGPDGIGIARGQVEDTTGFVAEVAQPLLIEPRN